MRDGTTNIAGIEIPSVDPVFLTVVAIHVLIGLTAVISGAVAMLSTKGVGRHPTAGTLYFWSVVALVATATGLAIVRWAQDYHLFILGVLAFAAGFVGRKARREQWSRWPRYHIIGMGLSYVLVLTAFYVDNGKSLPLRCCSPSIRQAGRGCRARPIALNSIPVTSWPAGVWAKWSPRWRRASSPATWSAAN
jgi:hypothetical protein